MWDIKLSNLKHETMMPTTNEVTKAVRNISFSVTLTASTAMPNRTARCCFSCLTPLTFTSEVHAKDIRQFLHQDVSHLKCSNNHSQVWRGHHPSNVTAHRMMDTVFTKIRRNCSNNHRVGQTGFVHCQSLSLF